ncbi:MAG: serine protease [Desulfobacteraceae bacterium]|jgi:membrane-bound ClpP family serine protease|nr:serine protease [Desulfobacteraceae bacterium]
MIGSLILPVILQLIGVVVLIAEIIIPSGGILGIITVSLMGYSLYLVFTTISTFVGMVFVIADIIMFPIVLFVGIKLLSKSPATLKTSLSKTNGFSSQSEELIEFMGLSGEAVTDLRPAGTAVINNRRVDVVSRGEYLDKGTKIVVLAVEGNRVVVKQV